MNTAIGPVWFVGAGPGDPELITVKGRRLIEEADVIVYAGSLVPVEMLNGARADAERIDSSSMTLEETHAVLSRAARAGKCAVRLHTGDPGLYGAMREQKHLLDAEGIPSRVVPGISAAFAAAAAAGLGFTVPETVQSLAVTRVSGRTPVPEGQSLREYAAHGGSLAVYLSSDVPEEVTDQLLEAGLPEDTPIVIAYRVGWPEERIIRTLLKDMAQRMREERIIRQTVILVLPGEAEPEPAQSKLYAADFSHGFRQGK